MKMCKYLYVISRLTADIGTFRAMIVCLSKSDSHVIISLAALAGFCSVEDLHLKESYIGFF